MKRRRAFILIELITAFFVVSIVLSSFFGFYTYLWKRSIKELYATQLWQVADSLYIDLAQNHLSKKKLEELPLEKRIACASGTRQYPLSDKIAMPVNYTLEAFVKKEKTTPEKVQVRFIEVTLRLKTRGVQSVEEKITYPLTLYLKPEESKLDK